jgi:hypothetical protein
MKRRRSLPYSFEDQLAAEKARLRAQLSNVRGPERDVLVEKIRHIETASRIDAWLSSRELQPPRR